MITLAETVTLMGGPKVLVTALREYLHSINQNKPWKRRQEGDTQIKVCQCLRKQKVPFEIRSVPQSLKTTPRSFHWHMARRTLASGFLGRHYPIVPSQPNAFPRHDDIFQKRFCNVHYRTMQDAKWGKATLRPKNPERAAAKLMGALSDEGLISHTRNKLATDLQEVLVKDLRTSLYGGEDAAPVFSLVALVDEWIRYFCNQMCGSLDTSGTNNAMRRPDFNQAVEREIEEQSRIRKPAYTLHNQGVSLWKLLVTDTETWPQYNRTQSCYVCRATQQSA